MIHLDKENFDDLIKKGNHLVDFYAEWCGPCKMMGPVLEEIEEDVKDTTDIIKVNIDNFKTYNTYIINNAEYQKSRDERIDFLFLAK